MQRRKEIKIDEAEVLRLYTKHKKWSAVAGKRHNVIQDKQDMPFTDLLNEIIHEEEIHGVQLSMKYFEYTFNESKFKIPRDKIRMAVHMAHGEQVPDYLLTARHPASHVQGEPCAPAGMPSDVVEPEVHGVVEPEVSEPTEESVEPPSEDIVIFVPDRVAPYKDSDLRCPRFSSSAPFVPIDRWAPVSLLAEGWTTGGPLIGAKVVKLFESPEFPHELQPYTGWVVAAASGQGDEAGPELFKVLYEDNDREDLEQNELELVVVHMND